MINIVTQNVRGINEYEKRKGIFYYLREKADIICLQETHSTKDTSQQWEMEFGGQCLWSHFTKTAWGTAILIRKNSTVLIQKSFQDEEGRICGIVFKYNNEIFKLINTNAPNQDYPDFFIKVFKFFEENKGRRILTGDFNVTLNNDLDRTEEFSEMKFKAQETINKYLEDTMMTDIRRDRNPDTKSYTYSRRMGLQRNKLTGSRLDYFLIDLAISA